MSNTQGSARPYFRTPTISPDGAQIAFVYAGDIWLVSIEGGDAERLYTRLGWTRCGVVPNFALLPGGGYCDTTYFYRELA